MIYGTNQTSKSYTKFFGIIPWKSNARKTITRTLQVQRLIETLLSRILFDVFLLFYGNLTILLC